MGKKFTEEKLQVIITKYQSGEYNCHSLAKELNISPMGVYNVLKRYNIPIENNLSEIYRKYTINHDYFDIIDCERKAYWIGLLFADGCNKDDRHVFSLQLKEEDKYLLEILRYDLGSNKPLYFNNLSKKCKTWNDCYTIEFNSKRLTERLSELGCIPRKSLLLEFPKEEHIPRIYWKHFIRGYIDGDGCISLDKRRGRLYVSLVSTQNFCCEFANFIKSELDINCSYTAKVNKQKETTSRVLSINGNLQVVKFLNWLYEDATLYMERKYNIYIDGKKLLEDRGLINDKIITFNNKTQNLSAWSEELGIPHHTLSMRLKRGWTEEETLSIPNNMTLCKGRKYVKVIETGKNCSSESRETS